MFKLVLSYFLKCLMLVSAACGSCAAMSDQSPVEALRTKYASLSEQLKQNQFKLPLVLESTETANRLLGDIYAVVDKPFGAVSAGLNSPEHWCEVMILHINTKYCHAAAGASGTTLIVNIGSKKPQNLADTSRIEFNYIVDAALPDYLEIKMSAKEGPMGTSNYHIMLDAVALPNAKTFLHFSYSYEVGFAGRVATNVYLATIGRGKVGFTVVGKLPDSQLVYIGGVRGVVERNTMRYFLAIDSYLGATSGVQTELSEQRFQAWYTASERYPRQLHDVSRDAYIVMKRAEYLRQTAQ